MVLIAWLLDWRFDREANATTGHAQLTNPTVDVSERMTSTHSGLP